MLDCRFRHSQVVRQRTANPLSPGSNPGVASIFYLPQNAGVAEQADARDLKSLDPKGRTGSTPVSGTSLIK